MHERYWGEIDTSLQGSRGGVGLIETPQHEEALARLAYLIEHRRRFGLIVGPTGTGKSLVLRATAREAKRLGREVATVDLFGLDSHDLLWQLAVTLRLGPTDRWSHAALWRAVCDHWQALRLARIQSVVLLDHLEHAESDCFGLIERLLHLEVANDHCLTVLAAARAGLEECTFTGLAEQSELRIELPCLSRSETVGLTHELLGKARLPRTFFGDDALETLFDLSGGVAREIVRLCQLAWIAAGKDELDHIDSMTLLDIASELPRSQGQRSPREKSLAAMW